MQLTRQRWHRVEKLTRFFDGHIQHFMNGLAFIFDLKRFAVIAFAFALIARHVDIRQEVHLNLDNAIALAGFTAAAAYVKAETARRIAASTRFRHAREQFTHWRKDARVGRRVRAWRAANRALIDIDNFIEMFHALNVAIRCRFGDRRAVELALGNREQRIVDKRRFTGARNASHAGKEPNRQRQGNVFEVVAARTGQLQHFFRIGFHALFRHFNLALTAHELARERFRHRHNGVKRAFRDDLTAVYARARADVDHVVGGADGVFIVLHHNHGIAKITQVNQRTEQTFVIALVQADGRLIQHIHHAHQARANLACQTDTLRLAARKRFRRTGERQVVQADVHQEFQAIANLFQHFFSNFGALTGELHVIEELHGVADAHVGNGRQRGVFDKHVARFATQTRTFAGGARAIADKFRQLLAHRVGFGLFVAALHIVQHAFKRMTTHGRIAAIVHIFEFDGFFTGAEQHRFLHFIAERIPRRFDVKLIVFRQRAQHLEIVKIAAIPAADGTARERQLAVLHHAIRVKILLHAKTITGRACASRVVKRKEARLKLAHTVAANRAGEVGGEQQLFRFFVIHIRHDRRTAGKLKRGFKRFGQALR
ncbi:hypothetical protein BN129_2780 [Cronobacter sakazakii 701]|nr:hypothetical protein BN129_2780 [Cronobacter sakazakii 701]